MVCIWKNCNCWSLLFRLSSLVGLRLLTPSKHLPLLFPPLRKDIDSSVLQQSSLVAMSLTHTESLTLHTTSMVKIRLKKRSPPFGRLLYQSLKLLSVTVAALVWWSSHPWSQVQIRRSIGWFTFNLPLQSFAESSKHDQGYSHNFKPVSNKSALKITTLPGWTHHFVWLSERCKQNARQIYQEIKVFCRRLQKDHVSVRQSLFLYSNKVHFKLNKLHPH